MKILGTLCVMALAMAIAITPASAQLNSNAGTVTLSATLPESLTVNVTAGNAVSFTLAANTALNPGNTTSTVKTAWVLSTGRTAVTTWAWVANNASVLSDGAGDNIPASAVSVAGSGTGSSPGGLLSTSTSGGAGVPTFITPAAASGVQVGSSAITNANRASSSTITLTWNINTTFNPNLPAATYSTGGIVNIQAQATP
ncbi:MAG TPA: hypothetical protein VKT33_06590 [Candidatus Angelobacter sp.]|nr:hypothetical protein [Candidatus Angelobacter sp.]